MSGSATRDSLTSRGKPLISLNVSRDAAQRLRSGLSSVGSAARCLSIAGVSSPPKPIWRGDNKVRPYRSSSRSSASDLPATRNIEIRAGNTRTKPHGALRASPCVSRLSLADPPTLRGPGPCRVTQVGVRARGFRKSRIAGLPYPRGLWVRSLDLLTAQGGQPVLSSLTELLHHQA